MKNRSFPILVAAILIMTWLFPSNAIIAQENGYEKYGNIAIAVVRADYPGEDVVEYKYLGRKKLSANDVVDRFRFLVKENNKDKAVVVKVKHNLKRNKFLSLIVEEQKQ